MAKYYYNMNIIIFKSVFIPNENFMEINKISLDKMLLNINKMDIYLIGYINQKYIIAHTPACIDGAENFKMTSPPVWIGV